MYNEHMRLVLQGFVLFRLGSFIFELFILVPTHSPVSCAVLCWKWLCRELRVMCGKRKKGRKKESGSGVNRASGRL